MSVIIRLQNLPWSANALDIRQFFRGLSIPEGGVHIVGGELGDAFIAFSTDEDARQAFQLSNGKIKEVQISLLLSSRTEMQKVIEAARTAQTPFLPVNTPLVTTNQTLLSQNNSNSPSLDPKKDEVKRSKSRERDDPKRSRDRSRRRSRSRTRSRERKDRSRDRRDRRRRDRSRSRDRRDRRRDRRGRSRSRDRTRSRDRDTRRKDDVKRDNINDKKDLTKPAVSVWEQKVDIKPQIPALLANFGSVPSSSALEDARRSLGMLTGLQQNINPSVNDMNRFPRNDLVMGGGNNPWPRTNQRFPNPAMIKTENVGVGMPSPLSSNMRPMLGNNLNLGNNQGMNFPPMYTPSNIRGPLPQDNRFQNNRPFLNGPNMFADQQQDRKPFMNNRNDDSFRNDSKPFNKSGENCVQLRPYYGGYGEVRKFFHGLFIYNTGLKFVTDSHGKRNGTVYVQFVRSDGKEQALARSGLCLRGVPVEITHLDNAEFERFEEEIHVIPEDSSETDQDSPRPLKRFSCVSVDDLPEFVKEQDILQLFSEYSVLSVHMVLNKQYRPSAYVKFVEEEDAKNAVKKTHVIRGKPVTIKPISNDVYADVLRQQTNGDLSDGPSNEKISPTGNDFPNKSLKPPAIISDVVLLSGMPQKTTERDVIDFFSDIGLVPARIHMLLGKFGPTGDCYCELNNPDEAARALDKHEMPLGTGTVRVELVPRREMEKNLGFVPMNNQNNPPPRFQNRFPPRGGGNMMGARLPPPMLNRRRPPRNNDGPFDHMGPPGCVVSMENVPFKASPNEILDFFGNFELNTLNVFRRFNDNGEPTGDARVTFNSPAEARRAVDECNQMSIRNRTIYLRILT